MALLENPKDEKLAQLLASGETQANAWLKTGYVAKNRYVAQSTCARSLKRHPEIRARVREIQSAMDDRSDMDLATKRRILAEIAASPLTDARVRIQAITEDNRMQGDHAATKTLSQVMVADAAGRQVAADDRSRLIEAARKMRALVSIDARDPSAEAELAEIEEH